MNKVSIKDMNLIDNIKLIKIRFFQGNNIKRVKRVVRLNINFQEEESLRNFTGKYLSINKTLGFTERVLEINILNSNAELWLTYSNYKVASFIINSLLESTQSQYIMDRCNEIIREDFLYKIKERCDENNIPTVEMETEQALVIGYGKNSMFLNEKIFKSRYNEDINKIVNEAKIKNCSSIPIISVTGTNGKTTTVRLIHNILIGLGYISGLASTGGIFIGKSKVKSGDTTGYHSARLVLSNQDVEVAVLETARGGIIRRGLGYDRANVAVFTSISEDHIGMEGANSVEELIKIKTLIFEELKEQGKIVCFNNPLLLETIEDKKRLCLFGIDFDENMKIHKDNGYEGMFLEDNHIIYFNKNQTERIMNVRDIPFTHKGFSKSNIKNVMAAIAAVKEIHPNFGDILKVLKKISCDLENNPGRQNILSIKDFHLVLDYGHNSEAFNEVFNIVKSFTPKKITAIIAAAGDRQDKYIRELGYIASKFSDNIIIREHEDLRERRKGESARLILQGVMDNEDFDISKVKVIYKEEEALSYAMKNAIEGEYIVLFTQCLNTILKVIEESC